MFLTPAPSWLRPARRALATLTVLLCGAITASAATYYVAPAAPTSGVLPGVDDAARDGLSPAAAWRTLAYACSRVPAGSHSIQLSAGTFQETEASRPAAGLTIRGNGRDGANKTTVLAPTTWTTTPIPGQFPTDTSESELKLTYYAMRSSGGPGDTDGCLIIFSSPSSPAKNVLTVRDLELVNNASAYCAILAGGPNASTKNSDVTIHDVSIRGFKYAGILLWQTINPQIYNCYVENSNLHPSLVDASHLGNITLESISGGAVHDNEIVSTTGPGYGYRGRGHTGTLIYNNTFDIRGIFDIEVAHDVEHGLQIFNNSFKKAVSFPRNTGAQPAPVAPYSYSIRIHNNVSTASYTFEGSRSYVEIDHNYVPVSTDPNRYRGRFYDDFGSSGSPGPVWIHHNVVERADRGFIRTAGTDRNFFVTHNTVTIEGDAGYGIIHHDSGSGISDWVVQNNIFIVDPSKAAKKIHNFIPANSTVTHNLVQNVSPVPAGNFDESPEFQASGIVPSGFYLPDGTGTNLLNRAATVNYGSFPQPTPVQPVGVADLGAFEYFARQMSNAGFEGNPSGTAVPTDWSESGANPEASTVSSSVTPHTGATYLAHYKNAAYSVFTSRTRTGLTPGFYTLRAWVQRSGAQTTAQMEATPGGGSTAALTIPVSATWTRISLADIPVGSVGTCTLGFRSVAQAGEFIRVDDVELVRQDNAGFEADPNGAQTITEWVESGSNPEAGFVSTSVAPHSGDCYLAHYKSAAYSLFTGRTRADLEPGKYTLRAWVQSSGNQSTLQMEAAPAGGTLRLAPLPEVSAWTQISIQDVEVGANGECTIGFRSVAGASEFLRVDSVEFFRQ